MDRRRSGGCGGEPAAANCATAHSSREFGGEVGVRARGGVHVRAAAGPLLGREPVDQGGEPVVAVGYHAASSRRLRSGLAISIGEARGVLRKGFAGGFGEVFTVRSPRTRHYRLTRRQSRPPPRQRDGDAATHRHAGAHEHADRLADANAAGLVLTAAPAASSYESGDLATVKVTVTNNGAPVVGATVAMTFFFPSGSETCSSHTDTTGMTSCGVVVPATSSGVRIAVSIDVTTPAGGALLARLRS